MELRHLKYFLEVAKELNFRKAAENLSMSQPPLSRQIRQLEEDLGVLLFDRSSKKVVLTDAGLSLQKRASVLLNEANEIRQLVKSVHAGQSGHISVGYVSYFGRNLLEKVTSKLLAEDPGLRVNLHLSSRPDLINAVVTGKLDMGITNGPVEHSGATFQSIYQSKYALVVPEGHWILKLGANYFDLLTQEKFLLPDEPGDAGSLGNVILKICQSLKFNPIIQAATNDLDTLVELIRERLGISILPQELQKTYQNAGVKFLPLPDDLPLLSIGVMYLAERDTPRTSRFRALISKMSSEK